MSADQLLLQRRLWVAGLTLLAASPRGWALDLGKADASAALKTTLERGAAAAVDLLGRSDGFFGNPKVRIPLPSWLEAGAQLLRSAGQGAKLDELELSMNRAAEQAVPAAKPLLLQAVKSLSVADARQILAGGETAVTDFFASRTREPLGQKFLPIITQATERVNLARQANAVLGGVGGFAGKLGLGGSKPPQTIEQHVNTKALDGLFTLIGDEERKMRQDPVGTGSKLLQKAFGG